MPCMREYLFQRDMCSYIEQLKKGSAYEARSKAQQGQRVLLRSLSDSRSQSTTESTAQQSLMRQENWMHDNKLRVHSMHRMTSPQRLISFIGGWADKASLVFCEKYHISLLLVCFSWESRTFSQKEKTASMMFRKQCHRRRANTLRRRSQAAHVFIRFRLGRAFQRMYALLMPCIPSGISKTSCSAMQTTTRQSTFALRSKTYPQPKAGPTYEPMSLTYQPMTLKEKGLNDRRYKTQD